MGEKTDVLAGFKTDLTKWTEKTKIKDNNHKKKKSIVGPYACYSGTREWAFVKSSLKDLESNQVIKITTVPEYVTGYIAKRLREESLIEWKINISNLKRLTQLKAKPQASSGLAVWLLIITN